MSLIKAQGAGEVSTGFYSHTLDQSLKFNDADSPYLKWTPASQGNLTTFTFSFWFKRSVLGSYQEIFHEYPGSGERSQILFMNNDTLKVELEAANTNQFLTNMVFRDTSAWYNIVVVFNSGDSTSTNRVKIYVNGVDQADTANGGGGFSTANYPSQSATSGFNRTNQHEISTYDGSDYHLDGYLAEVNFIDGTALTAASFGETKNGIWIPKDTSSLTFGTNGFHLTFKDDVVSEGFNTVTYRGNNGSGTTGQSISGVGFKPAFIWIKNRDTTTYPVVFDYVRGNQLWLETSSTDADQDSGTYGVQTHDADGWTMGGGNDINRNGEGHVAWCWEAGGTPTADNSAGAGATPTAGSVKIDGSNLGSALAGSTAATRLSADTAKGFSIVTFTSNGSDSQTVAHGLGAAPKWIIIKSRGSGAWVIGHTHTGFNWANDYFQFDSSAKRTNGSGTVFGADPTSTVFTFGSALGSNGTNLVAYCWAEISGYSAFGSFTGNGGSQAIDVGFAPAWVMLVRTNGSTWGIFDNTRQSRNLQMLAANSSAVETTNAQMNFSGNTFNDNGYLSDNGATVVYFAFADTREAAFFKDVTSNGNHFTPVNLDYRDSVPDVPTNNFTVLNPLTTTAGTYSEGNTRYIGAGAWRRSNATHGISSGKWYWEYCVLSAPYGSRSTSTAYNAGGFGLSTAFNSTTAHSSVTDGVVYTDSGYFKNFSGSYTSGSAGAITSVGDIIGFAVNLDDNTFTIYKNNSSEASGTIGMTAGTEITPLLLSYNADYGKLAVNFGQDSSFSGAKSTANSNADGNGHGSFQYAPPSGFLALCSQNLPDADIIDGTEHFNTVLYTGNAGTQSITGVGFSPDWLWVKNRGTTYSHALVDSVRGATLSLASDSTAAERTSDITSLDSDGFSLQFVTATGSYSENQGSQAYAAWNWLAGTAFSNDASATGVGTIDSSGQVNTKAGFSIMSYTGSSNTAFAHGLSSQPEMVWIKRRDSAAQWAVYHTGLSSTSHYLNLDDTGAEASYGSAFINPGSTTITIDASSSLLNANSGTYICYAFHSVLGYSKVGTYVGNGNADGTFVFTGMAVSWLMVKRTDSTGNWAIYDKTRDTTNVMGSELFANLNNAEQSNSSDIDFLSNGFKFRRNYSENNSSGSYIYLAFADQPFKFANAR